MKNLIEEYIKFIEENIKTYMKKIFLHEYDEKIIGEYITTYINSRYYNIYNGQIKARPLYLKIMDELERKCEILKKNAEDKKINLIEVIKEIFYYILFWDNVRDVQRVKSVKDIKYTIDKIEEIRIDKMQIKKQDDFKNELYARINDDMIRKQIFLENFETEKFFLEFEKNKENDYIYYSKLKYNVKMPKEYTAETIESVFNTGIILEDKLAIEYSLLSLIILRDILKGDFKDIYISSFPDTLLKKKKKMEWMLARINNQAIQEKLYLDIKYEDFTKNKEIVLNYIKEGFNFSITLDNSLKDIKELEKLKIFKIVFVNERLHAYKEIIKLRDNLSNIVKI